jgi:hypothetical protein
MGTTGVNIDEARQIANLIGLKQFYKNGKFVVTVQPGDQIGITKDTG